MPVERAFLVTIQLDPRFTKHAGAWPLEDEAQELNELAASSGCRIVGELSVRRHEPVAGTFLGAGKLEEIGGMATDLQSQVVIFNHELSPAQQRNIEEIVRVKTIDRTQLILDIFAQRAKSQEGQVQVELAQLRYLMPRLTGKGVMLSRLGGGVGTRGPGEQKLEVDRRRIRQRLTRLSRELNKMGERRQATRARRKETRVPVAALVGYTNAGKTTLLNRLTGAVATSRNQLFTTLDPLARRMRLPNGDTVILTDTVGFLHHLPHHLIEAFKATLEEARDADVLLHVLDASHPLMSEHAKAVSDVLVALALQDKPSITVLNKRDQINDPGRMLAMEQGFAPAVAISAKTGEGIDRFQEVLAGQLGLRVTEPVRLLLPAARADLIAALYQSGHVLTREVITGDVAFLARIPPKLEHLLKPYIQA